MKSKFLNLTIAAALLLAASLTGCTREEINNEDAPRVMLLKVSRATTRAAGAPVTSSTTVALKAPGHVFFVTSSGTIVKKLEIKADGTANEYTAATPDQVTSAQLTAASGVQIENVPASASRVHVFGTVPSTFSSITPGTNISEYVEAAVSVGNVYKSDGSVDNVILAGSGSIVATVTPGEFTTTVQVSPAAGRVELAKVSVADEIASFTVAGVYVNYYYDVLGVNGKDLGSGITNFENNGSTEANYAGTSAKYTGKPALHDEPSSANSVSGAVTFGAGKSLAYNLLAPNFTPSFVTSPDKYFPHLVLKITNVVPKDGTLSATYTGKTWYITVTSVALAADLTAPLAFEAGKVYNIGDLSFGLGDLTDKPEPDVKKVRVKVTVKTWEQVNVVPGLN
jgi:hypothetical protein